MLKKKADILTLKFTVGIKTKKYQAEWTQY